MVKLEELLSWHERIRVIVEEKDNRDFLSYAKENGCLWDNGRIIQPEFDKPNRTTNIVVITKEKLIHYPSGYIAHMSLSNTPKYYFKDIKEDINKDIDFEEKIKLRQSIEDRQKAYEEEKASFKRHIKYQREINTKQLKYQKFTIALPNQFFVEIKDTNELIELFRALENYGYENINNINPLYFDESVKVIYVDNKKMTFFSINTMCVACAYASRQKFYDVSLFVEVIERVFKQDEKNIN